jgi:probable rRNA maturation factor
MARLHRRHLGRLSPTDVLAFDMRDTRRLRERRPHSGLEGEIVVSYDAATREARRRGHAWKVELALYALHGTLHLLGYDDHSPRRAQRMHSAEDRLLKAVGFGATFAPTSKR